MPFAEQKEYIPFPHMVEGIFYCLGSVGYLDIFARSAAFFDPSGYLVDYRVGVLKVRVVACDYDKIAHPCADKTELLPADCCLVARRAESATIRLGL